MRCARSKPAITPRQSKLRVIYRMNGRAHAVHVPGHTPNPARACACGPGLAYRMPSQTADQPLQQGPARHSSAHRRRRGSMRHPRISAAPGRSLLHATAAHAPHGPGMSHYRHKLGRRGVGSTATLSGFPAVRRVLPDLAARVARRDRSKPPQAVARSLGGRQQAG